MADDPFAFACGMCGEKFSFESSSGYLRLPLLLNCSHRICSQCLVQKQNSGWINCKQCFSSQDCHSLPKDFYIIGLMTRGDVENSEVAEEPPQLPDEDSSLCLICIAETTKSCSICKKLICDVCFATTHNSEFFADHQLVDSSSAAGLMALFYDDKICPLHNSDRTLYCNNCRKVVCLGCSRPCSGHETKSVESENKEKIAEFRDFKESLIKAIEKDCESLKLIDCNQSSWKQHGESAHNSINNQIAHLIAVLQIIGVENNQKVNEVVVENTRKLTLVKSQLRKDIEVLRKAVASVDYHIENIPKNYLLVDIMANLQKFLSNVAVEVKNVDVTKNPLKFEVASGECLKESVKLSNESQKVEPRILTGLRNVRNEETEVREQFTRKTVAVRDGEDSWESESDDESTKKKVNSPQASSGYLSKQISFESSKQIPVKNPNNFSRNLFQSNVNKRVEIPKQVVCELETFPVEVTHFLNVMEFFVLPLKPEIIKEQENLSNNLQKFYNSSKFTNNKVDWVVKGFYAAVSVDGSWRRCVVTKIDKGSCGIFLMDLGKETEVETSQLFKLNARFWDTPQGSIKCKLADVAAKRENKYIFHERALKEFEKILKFKIEIFVLEKEPEVSVVVNYFPGNNYEINFNAVLVHKLGYATSTGSDSRKELMVTPCLDRSKPKMEKKKKLVERKRKRVAVDVLHIVDPGEFYVALKSRENEAKILQTSIQIVDLSSTLENDWKFGDFCLVQLEEIFRGKILNKSGEKFEVFLIDKGNKVEVEAEKLSKDSSNLPPIAIRVHLAGAAPTCGGKTWPQSSIGFLKQILNKCDDKFISIVGEKDDRGSFPVIFWLATTVAGLVNQQKFFNVSDKLWDEGFIDRVGEKCQLELEIAVNDRIFGWVNAAEDQELTEESESEDEDLKKVDKATSWLPAVAVDSDNFIGVCTNVDDNGIISIQDEKQRETVEKLQKILKQRFSLLQEDFTAEVEFGQVVIVQNVFDGEFYRGIVEDYGRNDFSVKFVDFGVVETVKRSEIFTKIVTADIPVQSRDFRIGSIFPIDGEWSPRALDFLRSKLVDVQTEVYVTEASSDTIECSITLCDTSEDISQLLIDENLARHRQPEDKWPAIIKSQPPSILDPEVQEMLREKAEEKEMDEKIAEILRSKALDASQEETKEYLQKFQKDLNVDNDEEVRSIVSSCTSLIPYRQQQTVSEFGTIPRRRFDGIPQRLIMFFDLEAQEITEFDCTFAGIIGKLYVKPEIAQLKEQIAVMEEQLQKIDENSLEVYGRSRKASMARRSGQLCLVKLHGNWQRGKFIEMSENRDEIEIFLIDSGDTVTFPKAEVRAMPVKFQNFPRKTLAVVLNGIEDINMLNSSGQKALNRVLTKYSNKKMRAVVKEFDENEYPVVDLVDEEGKLVYQGVFDGEN